MTYATTQLNAATVPGGDRVLNDSLTTVDGLPAPASAVAQMLKLAYGGQNEARSITDENGMPVKQVSAFFWRVGFAEVGSGLQGLAAAEMTLMQTGAGMAVSQSAGNLVITTGTTANSETVLRSNLAFRGALLARYKAILSQRIANQTFRFELADLIGTALAFTINSSTSVTVTIPSNPFTAANVGQSLRLSVISGAAGIPGRYAIASVSGNNVTFTVAGWPATGTGTLTLYGHNWLQAEYSGTTATNVNFDAQRRGWASGNTAAAINSTASPGHVGQLSFDVMSATYGDSLVATNAAYQWTNRASRIENIPDEDVDLYFFLVVQNGSTAPASTTTLTVGFLSVEDQPRNKVRVSGADPSGGVPMPVQIMGGSVSIAGTAAVSMATNTPTLAAGTNLAADFAVQYRPSATGAGTPTNVLCPATPAVQQIKGSAGRLLGFVLTNNAATTRWLKVWNVLGASVTLGTTAAAFELALPPGQPVPIAYEGGLGFSTAISIAITGAQGLTNNTAVTAGDVTGFTVHA